MSKQYSSNKEFTEEVGLLLTQQFEFEESDGINVGDKEFTFKEDIWKEIQK